VRFVRLAEAMGVGRIDLLGTAAIRDAGDGSAFAARVEDACGRPVRVLSGEEEARLSAMGVLLGMPDADGVMGDLGGGSLELVSLEGGRVGAHATLPLGPLRLSEAADGDAEAVRSRVDAALEDLDWLKRIKGGTFYPVGGSWRTMARIHMEQAGYPLHVIQNYQTPRRDMEEVARLIAGMGRRSLARLSGVARRRLEILPYAALVLERTLKMARPARVVFSAYGLREGHLFDRLPKAEQAKDPLLSMAAELSAGLGRFGAQGEMLLAWTDALFPDEGADARRLRLAVCELSDIGWRDHPDYRAEQAMLQALRLPLLAIDHPGRGFLALALYIRYGGDLEDGGTDLPRALLGTEGVRRAEVLGHGLRLAYALTGAAPGILAETGLDAGPDKIGLRIPRHFGPLMSEQVQRRLDALGRLLDRPTDTVFGD
jgi:exopolyphosphatase/guanosine-5'-triphosphate,3'-diphosphate pyrophosphatase